MIDIRSAVIAAVSVLALVGGIYWIWSRRTKVNGDQEQRDQTKEDLRLESQNPDRRERVGFVGRARVQPRTTLLFFGCIIAFMLVVAVGVYQVAKGGSPQEMAYADQIEYALTSLIFIAAGIWFKMKLDRKAGELNITYEGETSNTQETLYYDRSLVQPLFNEDGDRDSLLLPVFKKNRILGLFWTPKLVTDEDRVRDIDKNLPDDQITYEVPLDQSTTRDQEAAQINVRAKDTDPVSHPNRRATYEFVPSDRKSDAEIQDILDENEQLRKEIEHEKRMNSVHTEQLENLEEALENREHDSLDHLDNSFDILLQMMHAMNADGRQNDDQANRIDAATPGETRPQAQNGTNAE